MKLWDKIRKVPGLRFGLPYVRRADRARDHNQWIDAVVNYRRGLDWMPWREDLIVQIGNCLKEFGDYEGAARSYSAIRKGPSRFDAQRELDDLDRRAGKPVLRYRVEESAIGLGKSLDDDLAVPFLAANLLPNRIKLDATEPRRWLDSLGRTDQVAMRIRSGGYGTIKLDQVGALSLERGGVREPLLTGIVALRGRVMSLKRLERIEITLGKADSIIVASAPLAALNIGVGPLKLHIFNLWIDSAQLPLGRHWLSVEVRHGVPAAGLFVNVAEPGSLADGVKSSNSFVPSVTVKRGDPGDEIAARSADIHPARRALFDHPIQSILLMRVDQLGDVSASMPAMVRVRALFPDARISVLVQPAVAPIIDASRIADRVIELKIDYNYRSERRYLEEAEEARLRAEIADESFDLAIDLCPGNETRPLLLLSGATYMVGFNPDRFSFLDFGIGLRSRDKVNQLEYLSHAASVLSLIEALAVAIASARPPVPRVLGPGEALSRIGFEPKTYAVIHTGARHEINEWPVNKFLELAAQIVGEFHFPVVIFADRNAEELKVPGEAAGKIRVMGRLEPDEFDAIVSNAVIMIGNDSGPKHLAAVRGVPTVSVQVGRLNWNEWGQDSAGVIVSKRVPCAGCGLNDIQLCGRDAVCIRSIEVDEIMQAVRACLPDKD